MTWYHLLETIRQYAAEKLDDAGERNVVRDRHLDYFMRLGKREQPLMFGTPSIDQVDLFQRVERNLDNVRQAWEWAKETGQVEKGLHLILSMGVIFHVRAEHKECITRLQTLLNHPAAAQNTQAEAEAYIQIARFQLRQSELELSCTSLEKAEAVLFIPDDPRVRADILGLKAECAREQSQYLLARAYLEQWQAFIISHNHLGLGAETLAAETAYHYGILLWYEGKYGQAKASLLQGYEWNRKTGNKVNTTTFARHIGYVMLYGGEMAEAVDWFQGRPGREFCTGEYVGCRCWFSGLWGIYAGPRKPIRRRVLIWCDRTASSVAEHAVVAWGCQASSTQCCSVASTARTSRVGGQLVSRSCHDAGSGR